MFYKKVCIITIDNMSWRCKSVCVRVRRKLCRPFCAPEFTGLQDRYFRVREQSISEDYPNVPAHSELPIKQL